MAEEFLENSDQHLQMTLAVTNTITHLMENKCKWILHSQKYRLDKWKRRESKSCCTILSKLVSKMFDIKLFLLSNLYFYTYFHLSPLLDHHFFGLWKGETAQYLSWKIGCAKKAKRPISQCDMRFFPCCVAIFWLMPYLSVLDFWKIKLEKSSSTNWIFILFWTGFLLPV